MFFYITSLDSLLDHPGLLCVLDVTSRSCGGLPWWVPVDSLEGVGMWVGGASREISIDSCDLCVWPSCLPFSVHVIESPVYRQAHAVACLWRFVDVSRRVYSWANIWKIIHGIFKIYRYNNAPGSVFMGIIEKHKICVLKDS